MLKSTLTKISQYTLQRKLDKQHVQRILKNINNIETVGILYKTGSVNDEDVIKQFVENLKSQHKKVTTLAYRKPSAKEEVDKNYFSNKQLNWLRHPKDDYVRQFTENPFDVLINLCIEPCVPIENIIALSKAKLRMGKYSESKTFCYDLMLETPGNNIKELINTAHHYLKIINNE